MTHVCQFFEKSVILGPKRRQMGKFSGEVGSHLYMDPCGTKRAQDNESNATMAPSQGNYNYKNAGPGSNGKRKNQ